MNERVKKLWIEALTSGEYSQATGALRRDGKFCCLGVLCDLHRKDVGGEWDVDYSDGFFYDQNDSILPESVMAWADLPFRNPTIVPDDRFSEIGLADLNDKGTPFPEIAELIEQHL